MFFRTFVTSAAQCRYWQRVQVLHSAAMGELFGPSGPFSYCAAKGPSVVGPSAWNDLPVELCFLLIALPSKFYISLKSFVFGHD